MNESTIIQLIHSLAPEFIKHQYKIATAESCTGGWLAKCLTEIEGSSTYFDSSIVTYSNAAKINLLGVKPQTLDRYGAVSDAVVNEMVLGLLQRCNANLGVSISGVAGPSGGTENKPVGTVCIAWAKADEILESSQFHFKGDRNQVRLQAVHEALKGLLR